LRFLTAHRIIDVLKGAVLRQKGKVMYISEAIRKLQEVQASHGDVKLKVMIQTGPDSWSWKPVKTFSAETSSSTFPFVVVLYA
jgi:hypothetical protein